MRVDGDGAGADAPGDLGTVAARVVAAAPPGRRALIAVDGAGGSGKSTFTAELVRRIEDRPVVVLHADDFFHPSPVRHARGRWSPEGFWHDAYDLDALVSWALAPLRRGDPVYRSSSFDRVSGGTVRPDPVHAPHDALVLVEGTFLHRDELAHLWDFSVYLDVPLEECAERMARRDGTRLDPDAGDGPMRRYLGGQRIYFRNARPWERASLVVDNTDVARPTIVDAGVAAAARMRG